MTSETKEKIKWQINYWYREGKRMCRGHDIIEASEDFTEEDAEEYLEWVALGDGTGTPRAVQEMNFFKEYACGDSPCNFKVLSIKRLSI